MTRNLPQSTTKRPPFPTLANVSSKNSSFLIGYLFSGILGGIEENANTILAVRQEVVDVVNTKIADLQGAVDNG